MIRFPIRGIRAWALFATFWLVSTLAVSAGRYAFQVRQSAGEFFGQLSVDAPLWWTLFGDHLVNSAVAATGALIALASTVHLPLGGGRWRRNLPLHVPLALAVVTWQSAAVSLLARWLPFVEPLSFAVRLQTSPADLFFYVSWLGLGYALIHSHEYRIRDLEAAARRARLARARLNSLRSEPHSRYLAEVLSALTDLLERGADGAGTLLTRLADFLRLSLENSRLETVLLAEELALVEAYLEVERFVGDAELDVEWRIDPETLDLMVPHPVLQRLTEAVVRESTEGDSGRRRLLLSARQDGPSLRLGVGTVAAAPGAGDAALARLASLRESLAHLFASSFTLEATGACGGVLEVVLMLPVDSATDDLEMAHDLDLVAVDSLEAGIANGFAATTPPSKPDPFRAGPAWLLFFGWWTGLALFFSNMYYVSSAVRGSPIGVGHALQIGFVDMYLWAAVCGVAFAFARRLPMEGGRWRSSVPIHVVAALLVLPGRLLIEVWIATHTSILAPVPFTGKLLFQGPTHATAYGFLIVIGYAIEYYRRAREREIAAWEMDAQVVRAQLGLLKMQLHPHFLFNALNAIATLVRIDPAEAARTTRLLEALLRRSLLKGDVQEVPLGEELEFLRTYLAIEQVRQGERLRIEWRVDPDTLDARVPHLILQPIVENAIRHGIAPVAGSGIIEVTAGRAGGDLVLEVSDSGAGFDPERPRSRRRPGFGLANTRERLKCLYPGLKRLEIRSRPGEGTTVTIRIPFTRAVAAPAAAPEAVLTNLT